MKDIKIGDPVRFGRNTGEYRGQFDKLNIAMVLVGNRLYYVTFEKLKSYEDKKILQGEQRGCDQNRNEHKRHITRDRQEIHRQRVERVLATTQTKNQLLTYITMKRTDLSIIMRTAWQMCRATGVTFAECLHKAWQVFKLKIKMRAGIVQFFYLKSSTGELRQAFGTLKDDLCPETKGDDRKPNKHLVTYYDTVAEGWRSFRMFNFVKVI